ncbi:hypothetical protein [uncultured Bifidobacterium sp.]|uniref:hypothetical protein n=1 Tax=uncultured Bifidobacterium sp. TaxID=165187 RepID=UPI0026163481|nr:hypothetical protein [uncultured Bifidobacterium sp.]
MPTRKPLSSAAARKARRRRVYLRRRIVAGLAVATVLAVVVFSVVSWARGIAAVVGLIKGTDVSVSRSAVPTPSASASAVDCGSSDVSLSLTAKSQTLSVGGSVDFVVSATHKGSRNCLIDMSASSQVLTITSGNDVVWTSASCESDSNYLLLATGDKTSLTITWNADRTGSTCVDDDDLPRVSRGTYVAKVAMKEDSGVASDPVTVVVQ